jgi:hypothetical protein
MKNRPKFISHCYFISFLIAVVFLCESAYAEIDDAAGQAIFVHDVVWRITADETKLPLNKGDSVYESDTITTGKKGSAQLVMSDGAYLSIRPNTSIRLDVYHYDKDDERGVGESVISLLKGCFRSITGLIGKENKENYKVKTPVASIGIRGTDHEPLYIPEPEDGEEATYEPGLYDKVNSGETYIENDAGVVIILPNQVGYASDQTTVAVVGDTIPDVYKEFSTTIYQDSEDSSDSDTLDDDSALVPYSKTSLDKQDKAQTFTPTLPTIRPDQHYGVYTWPDAGNYTGVLGFTADMTEAESDKSGHYSETTIKYGTLPADDIGTISYSGNGLVHWISGTISDANYLSQVITGTETYLFDGGTNPTNQDGVVGTLDTASLSVDFSRQALDVSLGLNVNSHDWTASANDVAIDRGLFAVTSPELSVEIDGDSSATWGNLNGSFAGEGLTGVLLGYTLGDASSSEIVNGTASFYAPEQDTNAPYREIGIAGLDSRASMSSTLALFSPSAMSAISMDNSGNVTGFDSMLPTFGTTLSDDAQTAVQLDIGSATLTDTGTDADTGISWGRWSGTITATDRDTGTVTSPTFDPQDLHYIVSPEMTSAVNLPIMGTKTYAFAGGTNPTDNLGNVGTLNSASLSADFTNMTVATGINATVNSTTFDASSMATPIESGRYFTATTNDTLALTSSVAGTTNTGVISGSFFGETGDSAALAYSFNTTDGASIDTTVSGVAAFK